MTTPDWFEDSLPPSVARALGSRIVLADGRELSDGNAAWPAMHGHNHPHIVAAIERRARSTADEPSREQAATLTARLAELLPSGLVRVRLHASSPAAADAAMQMAVQHWAGRGAPARTKFLAFTDAWPGHYITSLPRDKETAVALDTFLDRHAKELAGIIFEPLVEATAGMVFHDEHTLRRLRAAADKHDLLLIADERFSGFGRLGVMFACEAAEIAPDIMILGKGLTGGALPLAATAVTQKVAEAIPPGEPEHATGNARALAAANASLDLFERENRLLQANEIAKLMGTALGRCLKAPGVRDVRVRGGLGVVELDRITDHDAMHQRFVAEGVWIRPWRNAVFLTPALTIAEDELEKLTNAVVNAVRQ